MGAGGLWMPFHCDDTRVDGWASSTLDELAKQHANSDRNVEVVPKVSFKRQLMKPPSWSETSFLQFQQLDIDSLYKHASRNNIRLPQREIIENAGYTHAWLFYPPIVDAPNALNAMLQEIKMHENANFINVETSKYFKTMNEIVTEARALGCDGVLELEGCCCIIIDIIHHCGEKDDTHWKDSAVTIEEEPFGSETTPCYMIPRGDTIVVGGTYLVGDEEENVRESERQMILKNAHTLGIDTTNNEPVGEWVGFRPYRSSVRLEIDEDLTQSGMRVVHNYGFGGCGWTCYVGAAKEATSLVTGAR
eukprot:scaffold34483_cov171-Skeletonema_menzelii.AAC.1